MALKRWHFNKIDSQTIFTYGMFLLVSLIATYLLGQTHTIYVYSDWLFHASRAQEIFENLKDGVSLTFIASHTFHQSGAASFLFYPIVFLYPWAIFKLFLSPVTAYYLWYSLITFGALIVSYWSMRQFSRHHWNALIFSLVYVFNPYRLYLGTSVLGEFLAVTFLPLVFLGIYEVLWRDNKRWPILAIGLSLIAYCHILSVVLCLEFLTIIFILKLVTNRGISVIRLKALLSAATLTLGLVLFEIIPFLTDFIGQKVFSATPGITITMTFGQLLQNSFNNDIGWNIGFMLLATLLMGWNWFTCRQDWIIYLLAWIAVIVSTTVFPWNYFADTPFVIVQLTFRYLSYAALFLAVLFSKSGKLIAERISVYDNLYRFKVLKYVVPITFCFFAVCYFSVNETKSGFEHSTAPILQKATNLARLESPVTVDSNNYHLLFGHIMTYGEYDYYPLKARGDIKQYGTSQRTQSIVRHKVIINGKAKRLEPRSTANQIGYTVRLAKAAKIDLPVVAYKHTVVKVDDKVTNFRISDRGTPVLNITSGKHHISISYQPPFVYYLGLVISLATWLILIVKLISSKIIKQSV